MTRKAQLISMLHTARIALQYHEAGLAQRQLRAFWRNHALAPASTRRRWRCGR